MPEYSIGADYGTLSERGRNDAIRSLKGIKEEA